MNEDIKVYLKNIEESIAKLKNAKENKHPLINIINTELRNCSTKNEKKEVFNKFSNCFSDIRYNLEHKNKKEAENKSQEIFNSPLENIFVDLGEKERRDVYFLFFDIKSSFYLNKLYENIVYITANVKTSIYHSTGIII